MSISSLGTGNAQQVRRADIEAMAWEAAFLVVNLLRMDNLETKLKGQIADVQEQNLKISETNELMGLARTVMAKFDSDAQAGTALPDGEELAAFKKACAAAGFDADKITNKGEMAAAIENFKTTSDSLSKTQNMAMLLMQQTNHVYQETVTAISNHLKAMHDLKSSILQKSS